MQGLDHLDAAIAGVLASISGEALARATDAAAQPILQQALQRVPVRTGNTREHLQVVTHHDQHSATSTVEVANSQPGGEAHDAVFLEYGTSHMPAEPFMRPAFVAGQAAAVEAFVNSLQSDLGNS